MKRYHAPNETQMRTAVKGADDHDYYRRHRIPLLRIGALVLLILLCTGIFLFMLFRVRP